MTDIEVQVEVQLTSNSPPGQHAFGGLQEDISGEKESDCMESLQNTGQGGQILSPTCNENIEVEEPLSLLADVALAPPCGDRAACSCDCEACSFLEIRWMERSLQSMQLQLQFLMSKADDLQDCLVNEQGHLESEALAAAVPNFLYTCQPYFNHLESTTRSTVSQLTPLPFDIYTRRVQLLDFSQQLCDRLEQLVLTYANYSLLCLDETEPNSVSHFCIGQSQLGRLRLTMFLYCKPTPYLARVDTGLYKRMRWNVERLGDEQQQTDEEQGGEREAVGDIEYYFLCYEDIPNAHAEADGDSQGVSQGDVVRMWSIGQWVQVNPDPDTDDIDDWIMCEVPQANYHRLLFLGSDEPSSCSATDYLQQLLLSHQTAE
ncbi:UPF0575 protein C19orf67 homolog isoform X2 [Siniperca chuatsi]|uniref:UPF0575 protein C19orf67 homolog isoform X2 n=1 Tax=Siniperca chuatsi TaxID=119488 RepID=UPI001CE02B7A|nr:UPF0575 protein C19orf67 homolog isoform X2 [Siniperca chuatsi]